MNFKKALAEFACKLWRKWFPEITIKKYLRLTERIYKDCWKIENRKEITSKEIENWIFSNKKISVGTKNIYAVQIRAFLKFCKNNSTKKSFKRSKIFKYKRRKENDWRTPIWKSKSKSRNKFNA